MSKYNNICIQYIKNFQLVELQQIINQFNDYHLHCTIYKNRLINRIRKRNILEDISSFEKFIKQELNNIINQMLVYDVM